MDTEKMPDELRRKVELLTPMQKKYCEYRAKGLKQHQAAERAGSSATTKQSRGRVGYNMEQEPGASEYINWLQEQRARAACVDEIEIIEKIRAVYDEAMNDGKYGDANKAAQMLGDMIGAFSNSKPVSATEAQKQTKNDVSAFKESGETVEERARKIRSLLNRGDQTSG
jgi:hypothetical protein